MLKFSTEMCRLQVNLTNFGMISASSSLINIKLVFFFTVFIKMQAFQVFWKLPISPHSSASIKHFRLLSFGLCRASDLFYFIFKEQVETGKLVSNLTLWSLNPGKLKIIWQVETHAVYTTRSPCQVGSRLKHSSFFDLSLKCSLIFSPSSASVIKEIHGFDG